ncbi:glutamyl-tRNA(Gln) amidotransferase subunit E [Geobacillus sp. BCO2]|nr:glutamyl-tRNA(Gln) amidotransferase subunit E [Geobacillus sp. BCO2]
MSVLRMLKAALQNEAIKLGKSPLSEDEELTVLSRELKQRKDSLQEFENAGRSDLVEKVKTEIDIVQSYMPTPLTEDELRVLIEQTIKEVGASSKADMGKVMGAIMPKVKGRADGSLVNKLVQQQLS